MLPGIRLLWHVNTVSGLIVADGEKASHSCRQIPNHILHVPCRHHIQNIIENMMRLNVATMKQARRRSLFKIHGAVDVVSTFLIS